jgi:hypothetical protein
MAQIIQMHRRQPTGDAAGRAGDSTQAKGAKNDRVEATITQALYIVRLYAEILVMDETIIKRIRQLVATQSDGGDREESLNNMRLVLAQLEKVGQRIAYWNARMGALLKRQLSSTALRPGR